MDRAPDSGSGCAGSTPVRRGRPNLVDPYGRFGFFVNGGHMKAFGEGSYAITRQNVPNAGALNSYNDLRGKIIECQKKESKEGQLQGVAVR